MTCARNSSKALPSEEGLLEGNGSFCSNILSRRARARETRLFSVPTTVKSEDAISFGLIVTELMINALKHGFPNRRAGHIAVDFAADGLEWRLSVSDNGIGRQRNPAEPDQVGLGTSIVEALAHQLKAKVEIHPCNPGTETSIVHAA